MLHLWDPSAYNKAFPFIVSNSLTTYRSSSCSTLAPEVLLGRKPREWGVSAGARKDSSLTDSKVIVAVYEDTEDGGKKVTTVKHTSASEARL
jgi:hypothetical protein